MRRLLLLTAATALCGCASADGPRTGAALACVEQARTGAADSPPVRVANDAVLPGLDPSRGLSEVEAGRRAQRLGYDRCMAAAAAAS